MVQAVQLWIGRNQDTRIRNKYPSWPIIKYVLVKFKAFLLRIKILTLATHAKLTAISAKKIQRFMLKALSISMWKNYSRDLLRWDFQEQLKAIAKLRVIFDRF